MGFLNTARTVSPRALLALLLLAVGLSTVFVTDSLAVFTDQEANAANTFSTGTIVIDDTPDSAFLTVSAMAPGDSTIQSLTITNNGTLELRYAMTTAADNTDTKALRDELDLTVRVKTANPCSTEDGAVIVGAVAVLASGAFGNPAQGSDVGDRVLAASASEILCFKVELPLAAGNGFQGATTTATFTFDAEQTSSNP